MNKIANKLVDTLIIERLKEVVYHEDCLCNHRINRLLYADKQNVSKAYFSNRMDFLKFYSKFPKALTRRPLHRLSQIEQLNPTQFTKLENFLNEYVRICTNCEINDPEVISILQILYPESPSLLTPTIY